MNEPLGVDSRPQHPLSRRRVAPDLRQLMSRDAQLGRVEWIGIRPAKHAPLQIVAAVQAIAGQGLAGDHYATPTRGNPGQRKRQVTLIQAEHLVVLGALLGEPPVAPERVRRNLVVSGINLLALKGRRFRIGDALLEMTGLAHPCSRMEDAFGPGGYNAMRGHGGITAAVLSSGCISVGAALVPLDTASDG
jgi:MOSC domain-containing protein YiiM